MVRLICLYCDHKTDIDYQPSGFIVCNKCGDSNLRMVDLRKSKIDYYAGSRPFPPKPEKKEEVKLPHISIQEHPTPSELADLFF